MLSKLQYYLSKIKVLVFISIACTLVSGTLQAQWYWQNPSPQGNPLSGISFINNTGFAVGWGGAVLRTTNSGLSWSFIPLGDSLILYGVSFLDVNNGVAVGTVASGTTAGGTIGVICKTTDGGDNWTVQTNNVTNRLQAVFFVNTNLIIAAGWQGRIIRSTDGGNTWTAPSSGTSLALSGIYFTNSLTGFVIGDTGIILRTTDSGVNWSNINSGTANSLRGIQFINDNIGMIAGNLGTILKTTNGGSSWFSQSSTTLNTLNSVSFVDVNNGVVVGTGGKIFRTTNGGTNWIEVITNNNIHLNSVSFASSQIASAVGFAGIIVRTSDGGLTWSKISNGVTTYQLSSIAFADSSTSLAVGEIGTILRTTNDGLTWDDLSFGSSSYFKDITFINADTGIIVGSDGIYRTTNRGTDWDYIANGATGQLNSVMFVNPNLGFAAGNSILKTTDGGLHWTNLYNSSIPLYSIYFTNSDVGIAVGGGIGQSIVVKTIDGGHTWFTQSTPDPHWFTGVYLTDSNTGTIVGQTGVILRTTDGGSTWTIQSSNTSAWLWGIHFFNENYGIVAGFKGKILKTTDAGALWTSEPSPTYNSLLKVAFYNDYKGYVVGLYGSIIRTDNPIIPVELMSFTAHAVNNNIELNWQTATEINNKGFEVQRSQILNPKSVNTWRDIGFVPGFGTTTKQHQYDFLDKSADDGAYSYRLKQIDLDGTYKYSDVVEVYLNIPEAFSLQQNYPNPFNPDTKIDFSLGADSKVTLKIYDILGRQVAEIFDGNLSTGTHRVNFNGAKLNSGVYFYRLEAKGTNGSDFISIKKMTLLK